MRRVSSNKQRNVSTLMSSTEQSIESGKRFMWSSSCHQFVLCTSVVAFENLRQPTFPHMSTNVVPSSIPSLVIPSPYTPLLHDPRPHPTAKTASPRCRRTSASNIPPDVDGRAHPTSPQMSTNVRIQRKLEVTERSFETSMEMGLRCIDSGVSKTSRCIGAEHRRGIRATFGVAVLCALFGSHSRTHDGQKGPVLCRSGATSERHRSDIGATSE